MRFKSLTYLSPIVLVTLAIGCNSSTPTATPQSQTCPTSKKTAQAEPQLKATNVGSYLTASPNMKGQLKPLIGHVPTAVTHSSDVKTAETSEELSLSVVLSLNHEDELNQLLRDIHNPNSPQYGRYLSTSEFQARFSPTEEQVNQVKSALSAGGIQVSSVDSNRIVIHAKGPVGAIASVFNTEIHHYQDENGQDFFAPAYELQVPSTLPIQTVQGLENVAHARHHHIAEPIANAKTVQTHAGAGPNGGYTPAQISSAYNLNTLPAGINGAGQTLALFQLDGYRASDITVYENQFGLNHVTLENIAVGGYSGTVGSGATEVTLDIELMISVASGIDKILVYQGLNNSNGILSTYSKIASDNRAKSVSTSWGMSENVSNTSFQQSENTIFKQMAAQGQTIYAAAGDSGAYDDGSTLSVDDPASQPYVVGVGGTRLTLSSGGGYGSETTWGPGTAGNNGGGGGVSSVWTIPSWQVGIAGSNTLSSTTMRNVPDVALNSDPATGYAIYYSGSWTVFGGTSCAAPIWAAYTALINQQRANVGLASLGHASPIFAARGKGSTYASIFHDIQDNSSNGHYPAVSGYDNATGWGSFNGEGLFLDLTANSTPNPTPTSTPAPTSTGTGTIPAPTSDTPPTNSNTSTPQDPAPC